MHGPFHWPNHLVVAGRHDQFWKAIFRCTSVVGVAVATTLRKNPDIANVLEPSRAADQMVDVGRIFEEHLRPLFRAGKCCGALSEVDPILRTIS